ncbi:MAG: glycosyltransferase family 4 protein [Myxococcales bacterium]|nr:glycosyltransferase family 4 protein [Myxococcales bacterium]
MRTLDELYFSEVNFGLRNAIGIGISRLHMPRDAHARLESLFARLPEEFRTPLVDSLDAIALGLERGSGLRPHWHWRSLERLVEVPPKLPPRVRIPGPPRSPTHGRRLKILFVTDLFPAVDHGGGLRIFDLIRALSREHEVSLYSLFSRHERGSLERLRPHLHAVRVIEQPQHSIADFARWGASLGPFDAAHFVWPRTSALIRTARGFCARTLFELIEGVTRSAAIDLLRATQNAPEHIGKAMYVLLDRFMLEAQGLRDSDDTIAVTPDDAHFAHHVFGGLLPKVVPTCVSDSEILEPMSMLGAGVSDGLERGPSAVFIGSYRHPPNVEAMLFYLRAIHPRIRARLADYRVHVVGAGAMEEVKALAASDSSVIFHGPVDDLVGALRMARIGIAPLISGSGIRGKVNQYSAVGRPTVTTSIGNSGLPYVDGESIRVADGPQDFADAVVELLTDDELYARIAKAAERIALEHFSWNAQLQVLAELYGWR